MEITACPASVSPSLCMCVCAWVLVSYVCQCVSISVHWLWASLLINILCGNHNNNSGHFNWSCQSVKSVSCYKVGKHSHTHTHTNIHARVCIARLFLERLRLCNNFFFFLPSATLIRILWHLPRALLILQLATAHIKTDTKSSVCVCVCVRI